MREFQSELFMPVVLVRMESLPYTKAWKMSPPLVFSPTHRAKLLYSFGSQLSKDLAEVPTPYETYAGLQ